MHCQASQPSSALILLIILGLIENYYHQYNLRKFKYRVLVNGTRGKTTISRIIVHALNSNGIKTIGRTTGSEACIVMPDNSTLPFKRRRSARITEIIFAPISEARRLFLKQFLP